MTIFNPYDSTGNYIFQIEQHIQMLQHLVQALKLSEQQARLQRHPFGPAVYPQNPINTNIQDWNNIWNRPGFQQHPQPGPMSGFGGTPNTDRMSERGEAFRFFEQHKDALSPIQNLFNQSMTNGFANAFGPRAETDPKTNASGNVTTWVKEARLAQTTTSGIAPTYELHFTNSRGESYVRTYTLKEFAQATANNGVMNALISGVARSPKDIDGQAWDVGGRYIVSVTGVGSFVAEADTLPLLRLNKPIINLGRIQPIPAVKGNTKPTFLVTQVKGKSDVEGHFNLSGFVYDVHGIQQPGRIETTLNVLDLPENIRQSKIDVKLPTDYHRTVWILTANTALSLLEIEGVLMNEIITVGDLGNYPNADVIHDYREAMENIPLDEQLRAKAEQETPEVSPRETEITRVANIRQDLVKWLENWSISHIDSMDEEDVDGLTFTLLSTKDDRYHKLEITDNYMIKWFENRSDRITDGRTLTKVAREMSEDSRMVATIITFEALKTAIIQILPAEDGLPLRVYTTDLKRAKRFVEATKELSSRWFNVAKD